MSRIPAVLKIPAEVNERILTMTDPVTVAAVSQSCSFFRDLIHRPADQHLWRALFLTKFDDPRPAFTMYGGEPKDYPWSTELKRRVHSETLLRTSFGSLSRDKQKLVLRTLIDVICSSPTPSIVDSSQDLVWVAQLINEADIFKTLGNTDIAELLAQLHVYYGLSSEEKRKPHAMAMRTASRCFVYDLRKYKAENEWGPFLANQIGKVSWVHIDHIINIVTMNLEDIDELWERMRPPSGLNAMRPYSAPAVDENSKDWAGVEGNWYRYVCYMDYRDLYALNFSRSTETEPLNSAILEEEGFQEAIRLIPLHFHVIGYFPCATHPHRPTIRFAGTSQGASNVARVDGTVSMTADGQIRWRYISVFDGETQWCSEGIQVGSVASAIGVLGTWTGETHAEREPVGPFWLWKVAEIDY